MNTFFQCYLGTVVTYMLVLGLCMVLVDYPQLVFGLLLVAICIVEVIGTVNHPNIHMDAVELSESKRAARILCAVEVCYLHFYFARSRYDVCLPYGSCCYIMCGSVADS